MAATLRQAGAEVEELPVYRTVQAEVSDEEIDRIGAIDAVLLMSGSAARALRERMTTSLALSARLARSLVACIGPSTREAAEANGFRVGVTTGEHTTEALVAALAAHYEGAAGTRAPRAAGTEMETP